MSSRKNKQIRISQNLGRNTVIKPISLTGEDREVKISFKYFCPKSFEIKGFNNFYKGYKEALIAVIKFIELLRDVSNLSSNTIFCGTERRKKIQERDGGAIDKIEEVLINGAGLNEKLVKEEFERSYFEISFGDGHRLICIYVDETIYPLFIDSNHFICKESARYKKEKELYVFPCLFDEAHLKTSKDINYKSAAQLVIEAAKDGEYNNIDELLKTYNSLCGPEEVDGDRKK